MDTLLNKDAKVMYDEQIYHILLSYYLECRFPNESNLMKQYKQASAHLDEVIKDPYLRQVYKSYTVTMFLSYGSNLNDWEEKHKQWNSMQADIKDVALKTAVNAGFKEKKLLLNGPASLHKGDAIPAFSVIDKDGNTITQNDITGGWVYLTLWGTWCEPCRNEIPEKNKLGLANSNLRIVNICGRSKEAEWRKMIPDIAGINLYADRASIDQIEKGFRLQGYPHHVLISPEGKIYENGTLRPAEMPALLDKLLYQVNTNAINAR
jgi:thiol-disulfide isomerase/thioredoxin